MMVRACFAGLLVSLALVSTARAAEPPAVKKIASMDAAAMTAYQAGDAQRAKNQLLEAIVLGKESGLEDHAIMGQVYLHLGAVQADGLKDEEKARRYYTLALRIKPDIQPTGPLATPTVLSGLERAREGLKAAAPAEKPATATETPKAPASPAAAAAEKPAALETAKDRAKREANAAAEARDRERGQAAGAEAQARERAAAEGRARDQAAAAMLREKEKEAQEKAQKVNEEREKLGKDLAVVQDRERKEREHKEKLQKEKQDLEKQLAESKDREKKEREDKERLQKVNQDLEKQLIEARVKEKQEREAKDKLAAQDRERSDLETKNKAARDKVAEGPDMPGSIPQPVFCPTQDQWAAGEDVFIHCAPQSEVKAKELALFYRPSGVLHFSSTLMERNQKGWYVAVIPAGRVSGRLLQYYVEARSAKGDSVASNGKALSPNVMMIRPRGSTHAEAAPATPVEPAAKLTAASSTKAEKSRSSRRGRARPR